MTLFPESIGVLDPRRDGALALSRAMRRRLAAPNAGAPFRVWVPQCAGGESTYAAAISLLDALGGRWREVPLRVLSTDSDERSLLLARAGEYAAEAVRGLSLETLGRFFVRDGGRVRVRDFVKNACRFARHGSATAAPFANLDAIDCRATLSALPDAARREVLASYRAALVPGGLLFDRTGIAACAPELFTALEGRETFAARSAAAAAPQREDAKDAYVGEVMHELRSPIAIIRGSVEALRRGCGKRDRAEFLEFIESHSLRLTRLVDRLLDLSVADAKRPVTPARVPLGEIVREIAAAYVSLAKRRGISLTVDVPAELSVHADPADLPHVFGNLIDNAIKFTPRGGKVRIRGRLEGGEGVLTVRDSGCGIAPEDLGRVFERFFRSSSARGVQGTGLGLAIVRSLVEANGGRVIAENDPAGGAVFHVAFPLSAS